MSCDVCVYIVVEALSTRGVVSTARGVKKNQAAMCRLL